MNVTNLPSDFFSSRNGQPVRYVVLHTTQGTDSRTWLTKTGRVSAHYLVRGAVIYRLVSEDYAAWHAGRIVGTPTTPYFTGEIVGYDDFGNAVWSVNPNYESIGIEMEGFAATPLDAATLNATALLIRDIRSRRGALPLVSHAELSPGDRTDPGVNRELIDALLGEEDDMDRPTFDAWFREQQVAEIAPTIVAMKAAYDPLVATARANGELDLVQESKLTELQARIDKLRTI